MRLLTWRHGNARRSIGFQSPLRIRSWWTLRYWLLDWYNYGNGATISVLGFYYVEDIEYYRDYYRDY